MGIESPKVTEIADDLQRALANKCFRRIPIEWVPELEGPKTEWHISWGPTTVSFTPGVEQYLQLCADAQARFEAEQQCEEPIIVEQGKAMNTC